MNTTRAQRDDLIDKYAPGWGETRIICELAADCNALESQRDVAIAERDRLRAIEERHPDRSCDNGHHTIRYWSQVDDGLEKKCPLCAAIAERELPRDTLKGLSVTCYQNSVISVEGVTIKFRDGMTPYIAENKAAQDAIARAERAEYSQRLTQKAREDDRGRLQQKCSDWGAYWRASDAHGVRLTPEQSVELMQDVLGVEVEIDLKRYAAIARAEKAERERDAQSERADALQGHLRDAMIEKSEMEGNRDTAIEMHSKVVHEINLLVSERDALAAKVKELEMEISQGECEASKHIQTRGLLMVDMVRLVAEKYQDKIATATSLLRESSHWIRAEYKTPLARDLVERITAALEVKP